MKKMKWGVPYWKNRKIFFCIVTHLNITNIIIITSWTLYHIEKVHFGLQYLRKNGPYWPAICERKRSISACINSTISVHIGKLYPEKVRIGLQIFNFFGLDRPAKSNQKRATLACNVQFDHSTLTPRYTAWVVGKVPNGSPAVPIHYKNSLVTNKR